MSAVVCVMATANSTTSYGRYDETLLFTWIRRPRFINRRVVPDPRSIIWNYKQNTTVDSNIFFLLYEICRNIFILFFTNGHFMFSVLFYENYKSIYLNLTKRILVV